MAAEARFPCMGGTAHLIVIGPPRLLDTARRRLADLEARWSRFRPDSELCRLNRDPGTEVSPVTRAVVQAALDARRETGGRFDPAILPALRAAGYDRTFAEIGQPTDPPVPATGGVELDLGGIAKGFAADLLCAELTAGGARGACVNLGGDVRVTGEAPTDDGWVIAVADPFDAELDRAHVALAEGAVATSMRTRRTWTRDGVRRHHLIDPATGSPAATGVAAVTVIAATATRAEVWAKAAFLAGPAGGRDLLHRHGLAGFTVADDGTELRTDDAEEYATWTTSSGGTSPARAG